MQPIIFREKAEAKEAASLTLNNTYDLINLHIFTNWLNCLLRFQESRCMDYVLLTSPLKTNSRAGRHSGSSPHCFHDGCII